MTKPTVFEIDALLPQTQCGLCGYKGCLPYAKALVENNERIDLCPPGGVPGLIALGEKLNQDPAPFIADMQQKARPALRAVIREAECIGCTKCIQACPVDAIIGTNKAMHTVLTDDCTGCELCVAPCPVDCIDMIEVDDVIDKKDIFRKKYQAREKRLRERNLNPPVIEDKKSYLEAVLSRVKK